MNVLIITRSDDNESIEMVQGAITAAGGQSVRLDTDRFPTQVQYAARYDGARQLALTIDGVRHDLDEITAVWYRRLNAAGLLPKSMDAQMRDASLRESRTTLLGLLASLDVFHLDRYANVRTANNKQLQLQTAARLGLSIPRTLITNDPAAVREFAEMLPQGIVTKMLSSFAIYEDGREQVVFTNPVRPEDLEDLNGLRLCPMVFQERIPKAQELRVTIVGRQVFAAAIDSQASERAREDWRRDGLGLLEAWKPCELPTGVRERLLKLMDFFMLNYGAADFVVTPDGRHVFLEVNPVGEYFWLDRLTGLPISAALADVLLDRAPRR